MADNTDPHLQHALSQREHEGDETADRQRRARRLFSRRELVPLGIAGALALLLAGELVWSWLA